jgi:hypothetical protein
MARMSRGFQFSLKTILVAILVVSAFFAGIRFERERQRRMTKPYNNGHQVHWTF